jgi:hypothetical protein
MTSPWTPLLIPAPQRSPPFLPPAHPKSPLRFFFFFRPLQSLLPIFLQNQPFHFFPKTLPQAPCRPRICPLQPFLKTWRQSCDAIEGPFVHNLSRFLSPTTYCDPEPRSVSPGYPSGPYPTPCLHIIVDPDPCCVYQSCASSSNSQ